MPLAAEQQRNHQASARAHAEPAEAVPFKPRPIGLILQVKRPPGPEGSGGQPVLEVHALPDQPVRQLAGAGGDHDLPVVLMLDHQRASGH
jgi:hypothetical protein